MKKSEIFYSVLEYILAIMFIQGGIRVFFFADPLVIPGVLTILVGHLAVHIYGIIFFIIGASLLYAKWRKHKTMHKHVLMTMYLTCLYVMLLSILVNGIQWGLLTTVIVGVVAAGLWMKWKFKTEYIDPKYFYESSVPMRDDVPPSHQE